uniref:G protein-coupled receptor n=1 Tax=Pristionchus pacificus TaxID=54126 RepID=A0A8R1Z3V6_PRIPA
MFGSFIATTNIATYIFTNHRSYHFQNLYNAFTQEKLLVLLTALQCILETCDLVRIFLNIPLTRVSCIRFVGAPFAVMSFGNAVMYCLLGFEVLTLLFSPNLHTDLKICSVLSGWWVYKSWNDEEDRDVLLCAPPTALIKEVVQFRGNVQRSAYANNIILPTTILMVVFMFSWFTTGILVVAAGPVTTAMFTFCQTHYVYFFVSADNRKQFWKREQLLVLITIIQTVGCILVTCDLIRIFLGIPLTRVSCLRFIGGTFAAVNFGNAILCFVLGFEIIILISSPNWYGFFPNSSMGNIFRYKKMKVWWFHATLYSTFIISGWWIYKSWTAVEDVDVLMCIAPTALTKEVNSIRSKVRDICLHNSYIVSQWILINNLLILFQYLLILIMLLVKSNQLPEIRQVAFSASLLVVFAAPISKMLNIPASYVLFSIMVTGMLTFSQTHYVYFFVSAENRREFWKRETVCESVGQELAQLNNLNSLKLCCLGFTRVRMTMGILIFLYRRPVGSRWRDVENINLTILPLVDFRTFIDPCLLLEGGERALGIERAQREGRGHARETRVDQEMGTVIGIEFYLGSQTRLIFAVILTEETWKNCFRRHAIWSQRDVDMKNEYPHRHQHPREP